MSLNWKEIDCVLSELSLEGSRIQKIRQPDYRSLILDLYNREGRSSLLIALTQGKVRLHTITRKIPNRVALQRFAQLLRSTIQGGRIRRAFQIPRERIVVFEIERTNELNRLYLRLWGGNPNIIATDSSNVIRDVFFRRPGKNEISGKTFDPLAMVNKAAVNVRKKNNFSVRSFEGYTTFNEYIENYYLHKEFSEKYKELSLRIQHYFDMKESQLSSALETLEEKAGSGNQYELFHQQAELLKANLFRISPGMERITVENFYKGGDPITIQLKKDLSPSENVEKIFKKYKKEKNSLGNLKEEIRNIKSQLELLTSERKRILTEEGDLETALKKMQDFIHHLPARSTGNTKEKIPGLQFLSGPFTILVGRTAKENDNLLRRYVKGNDYWLHTRDFPGGYVFIKLNKGKSIPLDTLLDAGNLALYFSKGRKYGIGELYYTQVKYLRRAKDGKKGLVLPTQEKNLSIGMDNQRLDRLLQRKH